MSMAEIETLSITDMRADWIKTYLLDRGWKQRPFKKEGLLVFEAPMKADNGETIIQILPRSEQSPDFVMRARELVRALSVIENRPVWEVIHDIKEEFIPKTITPERLQPEAWNLSPKLLVWASTGLFILMIASLAASVASVEPGLRPPAREPMGRSARFGKRRHNRIRCLPRHAHCHLRTPIKYGDEWLRLKAIDALAELAETYQIRDVAEPALGWAAEDDKGSTPKIRAAAAKALNRIRSRL